MQTEIELEMEIQRNLKKSKTGKTYRKSEKIKF